MPRGIGAVEAVQSLLPEWSVLPFGLLTQLGDVWFLCALVALAYWSWPAPREGTAVVGGLALTTLGVLDVAKALFALPRPDLPLGGPEVYPALVRGLYGLTATAGGHGFPSGHATFSTVVYLALAAAVPVGSARRRFGLATVLIVLVSLSRVALGVHYLVDVVAGVLLGSIVLVSSALVLRASPVDRPTTAFALAVAVAVVASLVTGGSPDVLALLGGALGALAGWQAVVLSASEPTAAAPAPARRWLVAGVGIALVAAVVAGAALWRLDVAAPGVAGVLAFGVLTVPLASVRTRVPWRWAPGDVDG